MSYTLEFVALWPHDHTTPVFCPTPPPCREVSRDFGAATPSGRSLLQAAFTQLLLYYNRFLELLKRQGPGGLAVVRDAVPLPTIMYGVKQYHR